MAHSHTHDHSGLDVQVERTGPCLATVRFTVTTEEYRRSRTNGLKSLARRSRMKGFRPGKVPPQLLEREYGEKVDEDLIEHYCQHALQKAVEEHELEPAASPRIDLSAIRASKDEDWGHQFEVLLRPKVELGEVEGMRVDSPAIAVPDAEVEAALGDIRGQMSAPEDAGEDGLPADGMAVCKISFHAQGSEEPVLARDGIRLNPEHPPSGVDAEAFRSGLAGARAGETRTFEMAFGEDFPKEEVRGQNGTCVVELSEAFRIVPPTDERVFQEFGVEDEGSLRTEIRSRIEKTKRENEERRIEHVLLERLIEEHPMDLPEPLVEEQAQTRVEELRRNLADADLSQEELEERLTEEHRRAYASAGHALRAIYLMEAIAASKGLQVTDKQVAAEFRSIAERNGAEVEQVRKYYQEERLLQQLALELLERNVRQFLRESADIHEVPSAD